MSGVPTIMPKLYATRKNATKAQMKIENQNDINQYVIGWEIDTLGAITSRGKERKVSANPPRQALFV